MFLSAKVQKRMQKTKYSSIFLLACVLSAYSLTHLLTLDIWGLGIVHLGFGITIGWAKVMEWGGMKEFIYIYFIIIYYYNNI